MQSGIALGWLVGADSEHRWRWMRGVRHRAPLFLVLFFAVGPAFSALNSVPTLSVMSLADLHRWGASAWAAVAIGGAFVAAALAWHVRHAVRTLPRGACAGYLVTRAAIFAFLGGATSAAARAFAAGSELRSAHLHHLFIAWAIAACGAFNADVSAALLALAAGVFVQGVGAYGFDPIVAPGGCKNMSLPSEMARSIALSANCRWDSRLVGDVVRVRVCPADAPALAESLFMRCVQRPGAG